ncbi:MAG: alpha/beta hydrolase family esterase [Bradymonadia bacterium]
MKGMMMKRVWCVIFALALVSWGCDDDEGGGEATGGAGGAAGAAGAGGEAGGAGGEVGGAGGEAGGAGGEAGAGGMETFDVALEEGLWRMGVQFVDVGGIVLEFQLELGDVTPSSIGSLTIRVIDQDGGISPDIATLTDLTVNAEGQFTAGFTDIVLPADYSPTGNDILATLNFTSTIRDAQFFCGDVRGRIETLTTDVEMSTFAAAPWSQLQLPFSCDWTPDMPEDPTFGPADRPASVVLPEGHEGGGPWPVVMVLHGYSTNGQLQTAYFELRSWVDALGFVLVIPEGTVDPEGNQFWNATEACCGPQDSEIDDVAYLRGLIGEAVDTFNGDADQVFLIGHSNGGYMSHRMACEADDLIAGLISLAGSTFPDPADCVGTGALDVVNAHGVDDTAVSYAGTPRAPGAEEVVSRYVTRNACEGEPVTETIDLINGVEGAETEITRYENCAEGRRVALWRHNMTGHVPGLVGGGFTERALRFMLDP